MTQDKRPTVPDPGDWTCAEITSNTHVWCYSPKLDRYAGKLVYWPREGGEPYRWPADPTLYVDVQGLIEAWERLA